MITKAERAELRSLIRQRFKLLRTEVAQRQVEMLADMEQNITERFATDDKAWDSAMFLIEEAKREANRKANDVMRELQPSWPEHHDRDLIGVYSQNLLRPTHGRNQLRYEGGKRIETQVKAALLSLDQQEAALLTRLALGVLESEEARAFLSEIPTVSALVPAVRLLELEQSLHPDKEQP